MIGVAEVNESFTDGFMVVGRLDIIADARIFLASIRVPFVHR